MVLLSGNELHSLGTDVRSQYGVAMSKEGGQNTWSADWAGQHLVLAPNRLIFSRVAARWALRSVLTECPMS